jgi:DNA polymerase-3 subunit alpha
MPDFDVDFCMDGRDRVIDYVADTYGREAVSQIITFGTMAAKAVVRDVARVQGKPYGMADKLSKLIPFEVGMTLEKAMAQEPALRDFVEQNEDVAEIMEMAFKLEGLARNVGKHAGGVVIAPTTLTDFTPLYCDDSGGGLVTQFDKDDVEKVGPGEVRLPRAAHADDHRLGVAIINRVAGEGRARRSTSRTDPARRRQSTMRC